MEQAELLRNRLIEKVRDLPEDQVQEVLDFVDFIKRRDSRVEDPILDVAGCLSGSPLSAEEIEEELYAKR